MDVRVVADGLGGAILVWNDGRHGYDPGLRAQHLLSTGIVDPAWPVNGRALTTQEGDQDVPQAVSDGAHGMIAAWHQATAPPLIGLYVQHMRSTGTTDPAWPANGILLSNVSGAIAPRAIVSDGSGGAIVTWDDGRTDPNVVDAVRIYVQHVRGTGSVDPAWPVNGRAVAPGFDFEGSPCEVSDGAHGVIVAWVIRAGSGVYAQHVRSDGTIAPGWPVNGVALSAGAMPNFVVITSDGAGGAIVAWAQGEIYAQHVRSDGTTAPGWPANGVALTAGAVPELVDVTSDGAGGAIVTWEDHRPGSTTDIYAQRILGDGTVPPGWPPGGRLVCGSSNDQHYPQIATDGAGGAIITWQDATNAVSNPGYGYDIYAQRLHGDGTIAAGWPVAGRNVYAGPRPQYNPRIAADGLGGAIIGWQDLADNWDVYAQLVRGDGTNGGTLDAPVARDGAFAVSPARENPSRTDHIVVRCTLPWPDAARVELMDVSGRVVAARELTGAGAQEVDLSGATPMPAGLYFVRLRQGEGTRSTRMTLIR